MRSLIRAGTLCIAAALTLVGCGGGGGGSDGSAGFAPRPTALTISFAPTPIQLSREHFATMTVRVARNDGAAPNPTSPQQVRLTSTDSQKLLFSLPGAQFFTLVPEITISTVGGEGQVIVHSRKISGPVQVNASATDAATNQVFTASTNVEVLNQEPPFKRMSINAIRTTLPRNPGQAPLFLGSPYMTEAAVVLRRLNGEPYSGPAGTNSTQTIIAAMTPVLVGAFSTLDDPATEDVNENLALLGSGPVDVNASIATVFIWSFDQPGVVTFTATFTDPDTNESLSASQAFTVVSNVPALPAQLAIAADGRAVYTPASGGNSVTSLEVQLADGSGLPVPDPTSSVTGSPRWNNVRLEIVGAGTSGGESLSGLNAAGQAVSGNAISVNTTNGSSSVIFRAGTRQGILNIRATADRADNNIDNGVQDPVTTVRPIVVSDGVLFAVELTGPNANAVLINRVSPEVEFDGDGIPPDPDGTYSLTVSAIATDRQGNPVVPGTPVRFGLIDAPISGYPTQGNGQFDISGLDGNPQEGNRGFTAPTGQFRAAGGGAGPGDAVLIFGEESVGNTDLESIRRVESIASNTSLTTTTRFNFNDTTGVSVDNGPVLPYIIGRASSGNISTDVLTNDVGVATTTLNYPVSRLGQIVAIWVEGLGEITNGTSETVTDVELLIYPGIASVGDDAIANLSVFPNSVPSNFAQDLTICVSDALGSPLPAAPVAFNFDLVNGEGFIDGVRQSGVIARPTGANGCVSARLTTNIVSGAPTNRVVFSVGGVSAAVAIQAPNVDIVMQLRPDLILGDNSAEVEIRLVNALGQPIPGVQVSGFCEAESPGNVALSDPPGVTDANGATRARITSSNMNAPNTPRSGQCTFTTPNPNNPGSIGNVVRIQGFDLCSLDFGPGLRPPECTQPTNFRLTLRVVPEGGFTATPGCLTVVNSAPSGITCQVGQICQFEYTNTPINGPTQVILTGLTTGVPDPPINPNPMLNVCPTAQFRYDGDCVSDGALPNVSVVSMNGARNCTAFVRP